MNRTAFKISSATGFVTYDEWGGQPWFEGDIVTPLGIVKVYSQAGDSPYSRYDMVIGGRWVCLTEGESRTKIGLAKKAHELIKQEARDG